MRKLSTRNNRGVHSRGQKEIEGLSSKKQLNSASSSATGTQATCGTNLSRSRTPSPQQQQIRGMDPGGLIVIPRRQPTTVTKTVAKSADVVAATSSDKEVIKQQAEEETTALVVASAVVTPPSTHTIDKASSLDKNEKNDDVPHFKETVSKSGKTNSTSASSAAVGNGRATEDRTNAGRQYRDHLWSSSSNGTKQSSSNSSRGDNGVDDGNRHRSNQDEKKVARKNVDSKLSKSKSSRGNVKESNQDKKSGEKQSESKKESLSKKKSSKQLRSISGSRDAIRSFSRKRGQKSTWKGDVDEDERKNKSWKDSIGSSPKKKSFMKRLGSKLSGKSASVGESEVGKSSGVSLYTIAPATPTTKEDRGRSKFQQQRAASKRAVRSNSPPSPQAMRRRQSLSPDRSESSQNSHDKERFYSRSRSLSPSPRRNRRSLSAHSSRASSYSGSRSPSPLRRRSISSRSCSSYSRSRSPRRRRSLSQSSHASVSISFYSRSRSPSPRRRYTRSVSPPSPLYSSRRGRRFHSRSRTPSPRRRTRGDGGAMMRSRRRSSPGVNQNRRDSFCSVSPPRGRRSNDSVPMRKQSSFNAMRRRSSLSSRSRSPLPRGGRRQMNVGNRHRNSGNPGPNRQISSHRGVSYGNHRRGSNSPPSNRSFSHEMDRRYNSDFDAPRKVAPVGTTRHMSAYQRRRSFEGRINLTQSPPRMPPQSQRQISDVYKKPVCRRFAPNPTDSALSVKDLSLYMEQTPMMSTPANVPRVEFRSSQNIQAPRRRSSASSTEVWIDCPREQNDPCDEDLTFSECQGLRDDDSSDATYDATHGLPSPGTPSVTHSYATYAMSDGPPTASGKVEKLTKPGRTKQGSNQMRSKAADLTMMTNIAENPITSSEGSCRSKDATGQTREGANVTHHITRNLSSGSLPSRAKKQEPPIVPGPPPRKPPANFALCSEELRPTQSEFVRSDVSSSRANNIASNGPATQQKAKDYPPSNKRLTPPPPPFMPRPNDCPAELNQPETSNSSLQDLSKGPPENTWQQNLPGNTCIRRSSSVSKSLDGRGNTMIRRSSSINSLEKEMNRGRRASSTERNGFRRRSLSAGRTHDRQVNTDDGLDITEVESGLRRMSSGTFPPPPPSSHKLVSKPVDNRIVEGPSAEKDWQQYLTKGNRNTNRGRRSRRSNSPERDTSGGSSRRRSLSAGKKYLTKGSRNSSRGRSNSPERDTSRGSSRRRSLSAGRKLFGRVPEKLEFSDCQVNNVVKDMPFTDRFGDSGIYTGQVNENGRPDGNGSMKYNNGIFYEGTWTDGCQDEKAVTQYDRIRGGFTSWEGKGKLAVKSGQTLPWNAHKNDKHDENVKLNVRGMEWVDMNGDEGRYTGEVNNDKVPHGKGIMKYDFGLIAEGEWVLGALKESPHDRVLSAAELSARGQSADAMSVMSSARGGGRSLNTMGSGSAGPMRMRSPMLGGGMSLGSGMQSGMSVGPGIPMGQDSMYGSLPPMMMPQQQMMMMPPQLPPPMMMMMPPPNNMAAQQNAALIAQQNAMMKAMGMYGGGAPPMVQMPPPPPPPKQQQQQHSMQDDPPITEIKFS